MTVQLTHIQKLGNIALSEKESRNLAGERSETENYSTKQFMGYVVVHSQLLKNGFN